MCPFETFCKFVDQANKTPGEYVNTYNPRNGLFRHYWKHDEAVHIVRHLNGTGCLDTQRQVNLDKCTQVSVDGKRVYNMQCIRSFHADSYHKSIIMIQVSA